MYHIKFTFLHMQTISVTDKLHVWLEEETQNAMNYARLLILNSFRRRNSFPSRTPNFFGSAPHFSVMCGIPFTVHYIWIWWNPFPFTSSYININDLSTLQYPVKFESIPNFTHRQLYHNLLTNQVIFLASIWDSSMGVSCDITVSYLCRDCRSALLFYFLEKLLASYSCLEVFC